MSGRQKWGYGAFGVGLVLSIISFVVFGASSGAGLKSAFLSAAMVCVVAAANGLAVGISDKVSVGKWTGLVVGAVGFVIWGIVWLAQSCSAGDIACTDVKSAFGWAAIFSAIAAVASLLPELFGWEQRSEFLTLKVALGAVRLLGPPTPSATPKIRQFAGQ